MRKGTRSNRKRATVSTKKPNFNLVSDLVRPVGPEHFGVVAVDCSKRTYAVRTGNYYEELALRQNFPKTGAGLELMVKTLQAVAQRQGYSKMVAGVEMTGTFHHEVKRALTPICTKVLTIHPFTTKQLRQPASPGVKTDDVDLEAITRAIVAGYGWEESDLPSPYLEWRILARMRADLVQKATAIKAQCKELLERIMPGYDRAVGEMWQSPAPWKIVRLYNSPQAIARAGVEKIRRRLRASRTSMSTATLQRIVVWAGNACTPLPGAPTHRRVLRDYLGLLERHTVKIQDYETLLLDPLVRTSGVVLLTVPGINVVSASAYAAELGPVWSYPSSINITGRAGLFPSRYQSDETDRTAGRMVGGRNVRLRQALLTIARNLKKHNDYFAGVAELKKKNGWNSARIDCAIAGRFARISFHMLAGPMVFDHRKTPERDAAIPKILRFAHDHGLNADKTGDLAVRAVESLPYHGALYEIDAMQNRNGQRKNAFPKVMLPAAERAIEALWEKCGKETRDSKQP